MLHRAANLFRNSHFPRASERDGAAEQETEGERSSQGLGDRPETGRTGPELGKQKWNLRGSADEGERRGDAFKEVTTQSRLNEWVGGSEMTLRFQGWL